MIQSVIEEEVSELYTDSGVSHRRKSCVFLPTKEQPEESEEKEQGEQGEAGKRKWELELEDMNKSKNKKKGHKIAKSEMFHLQLDLKHTFDTISSKKSQTDESSRNKIETMKKQLVDQFFQSYTKKSQVVKARYETIADLVMEDSFDMELKSPVKEQVPETDFNIAAGTVEKVETELLNLNLNLREQYKRERNKKKSSIFKSEDLRVGKVESVQPTINTNNNRDRVFGDSSDRNDRNDRSDRSDKKKDKDMNKKEYVNINNNFHFCSPISVISNTHEDAERLTLNLLTSLNEISSAMNLVVTNNVSASGIRANNNKWSETEPEPVGVAGVSKKLFHPLRHENLSIVTPIQLDIVSTTSTISTCAVNKTSRRRPSMGTGVSAVRTEYFTRY